MHFERCSGAVALADADISMPNLKRAGSRWALISAVKQYMEHIHASKVKRVALLDKSKSTLQ
eukprot:14977067-Ditylum_brightwellii.AAC.2